MFGKILSWQKNTLRILAGAGLVALAWSVLRETAYADGVIGAAEPESDFFSDVLRSIFTFDTTKLMHTLSRPEYAIAAFVILNVIVFTETGLLIGFFLPGDSLLVITGLICANPECQWNMPLLLVTLSASAIIGDTVGYWIGFKAGPKIFNREKSFFFHKDHLLKAKAFYDKHGGVTIILARFVPFLRTFAPVVAGVAKMEYRQFLFYNVFGGIAWVFSMVLAGRFLPAIIDPVLAPFFGEGFHVAEHIEKVVILVVFLSILPMVYGWLKSKMKGVDQPAPPTTMCEVNEPATV
jgi:membrane-associated protein